MLKSSPALDKAKLISLVLLDVDGVLTDGKIYFTSEGIEYKAFHSQDGLGIKMLLKAKIEVGVVTARTSTIVEKRMSELGIKYISQGQEDKLHAYEMIKKQANLQDHQICFIGDDLIDLGSMQRSGLGIAVANATSFVQQHADWITSRSGGQGAVREACEFILSAQQKLQKICEQFLFSTCED